MVAGPGTSSLGPVQEHVDVERLIDLASTLIAVGTPNPPGNEAALAGALRDALAPWRPIWTEVEPAPGRLSLIARVPGRTDRRHQAPGDAPP